MLGVGAIIERYNYRPRAGFGPTPNDCELGSTIDEIGVNGKNVFARGWVVDGCSPDHLGTPSVSVQLRVDMAADTTVVANDPRLVLRIFCFVVVEPV